MAEPDTSRDIDQAASNWAARLDREPLTPREEEALRAWLGGDLRRKGALLRAQAMSLMSESAQALGPHFDPARFEAPNRSRFAGLSRRQALSWAGGGAAVASLAAWGVSMPAAGAVISTARGEIRLAPLKDGSTVLLNTQSRIRVKYNRGQRLVVLLKGEAYFAVARDEARPFIVEVAGRRIRASQAAFRVRKFDADPIDVLVNEGQVDVAAPKLMDFAGSVTLAANTRLVLSDSLVERPAAEHPQAVGPEAVTRELAWREGKLAFEGESLRQAADAFGRYNAAQIQILDSALAREPVTGLFAANDPVGFSRTIASVFDARFEQDGSRLILSRDGAAQ